MFHWDDEGKLLLAFLLGTVLFVLVLILTVVLSWKFFQSDDPAFANQPGWHQIHYAQLV